MGTESHAIQVEGLRKTYRDGVLFPKRFEALKGISFDVPRGEAFGLLGPNGAGKTTFVKVLLGIIRRSDGAVQVFGRPAGNRATRRHVGYLPEHLVIPRHHTALTSLVYYGGLSGLSARQVRERAPRLLETVGLAGREKDLIRKYSKGMLQRLGLAQALLHDPDLLILDEPTDGLDPVGRAQIRTVLAELKSQGKTIFLNSHLLQEVELICDRVAVLDRGSLRGVGRIDEIAAHSTSELEIEIELAADEATVREALAQCSVQQVALGKNGFVRARLFLTDQAEVDQLIDHLRTRRISIVGITRRRITLEDAFLNMLGKSD